MLIQFDHFAPAVRRGAIDVLLADLFHWGGVENFRDMAAAAEVFGLDAAIHSFYESGVATTANVHLALGLGLTRHANDQGHNDLAADVLAQAEELHAKQLGDPGQHPHVGFDDRWPHQVGARDQLRALGHARHAQLCLSEECLAAVASGFPAGSAGVM